MNRPADASRESIESWVERSLVRVCDAQGNTLGTGFVIDCAGTVMTCDHVVGGRAEVSLHHGKERSSVAGDCILRAPAADICILRSSLCHLPPLPIASGKAKPGRFWTCGFQFGSHGVRDALPVQGAIGGVTKIEYSSDETSYRLRVWVLGDTDIDHGLSGGPLLDPDTGCVHGVIVAQLPGTRHLAGFAIPWEQATELAASIVPYLKRNEQDCPRRSGPLNDSGRKLVASRQCELMVERLERERLFLREHFCMRPAIERTLSDFDQGRAPVLPLIGHAGVGKTSLLAHLAIREKFPRPRLLLRGLDIAPADASLEDLIARALAAERDAWPRPPGVAEFFDGATDGCWVILDGLNEARMSLRDLAERWIPQSTRLVEQFAVKWVFSCRPEVWETLSECFPPSLLHVQPSQATTETSSARRDALEVTRVTGFSDDEYAEAAPRYGLSPGTDSPFLRHPLTLRLRWQLDQKTTTGTDVTAVDDSAIIERFITHTCRRAALHLAGEHDGRSLRRFLERQAGHLFEHEVQEVPFETIERADGSSPRMLRALTDESILVTTPSGYRFAFDDISEYLQSVRCPATAMVASVRAGRMPDGVLRHAITRFSSAHDSETLRELVDALASRYSSNPVEDKSVSPFSEPASAWPALEVAKHLLVLQETELALKLLAAVAKNNRADCALFFHALGWAELSIPVPDLITIVRLLLPAESDYPWRNKDWIDPLRRPESEASYHEGDHTFGRAVRRALERDAPATIAALGNWLTDRTALRGENDSGGEATVGDFALACLFHGRTHDFAGICELIAGRTGNPVYPLRAFATTNPAETLLFLPEWLDRPERQELAVVLAAEIFQRDKKTDSGAAAGRLLEHVVADRPPGMPGYFEAVQALSRSPGIRDRMWPIVRDAFARGDKRVSAFRLGEFLSEHTGEIIALIDRRIEAGAAGMGPAELDELVSFLGTYCRSDDMMAQAVAFFRARRTMLPPFGIARVLEDILYLEEAKGAMHPGLIEFCAEFLQSDPPEAAFTCLLYIAYPNIRIAGPTGLALREIVNNLPLSQEKVYATTRQITRSFGFGNKVMDDFHRYCARVPASGREQIEMIALSNNDSFRTAIEPHWRASQMSELGRIARCYLAERDLGKSSSEAARAARLSVR